MNLVIDNIPGPIRRIEIREGGREMHRVYDPAKGGYVYLPGLREPPECQMVVVDGDFARREIESNDGFMLTDYCYFAPSWRVQITKVEQANRLEQADFWVCELSVVEFTKPPVLTG